MIRQLFFLATLLVPVLAYTANPSTDLSVQIVPAGTTTSTQCPTVAPAEAQAAGFTTMVLCEDFTQPIPNTAGTGLTANWDGCGSGAGQVWYLIGGSGAGTCNDVGQVTDPTTGTLAMHFQYLVSEYVPNGRTKLFMQTDDRASFTPGQGKYFAFPEASLIEITYRDNLASISDPCSLFDNTDYFAVSHEGHPGVANNEFDVVENWGAGQGCQPLLIGEGLHNWNLGPNAGAYAWNYPGQGTFPPNFVYGVTNDYHTYGMLTTQSSSNIESCGYFDHVLIGCSQFPRLDAMCLAPNPPINQSGCFGQRNILVWWVGSAIGGKPYGDNHAYVKSFRVWSCPAWNATDPKISNPGVNTCYGRIITGENAVKGDGKMLALDESAIKALWPGLDDRMKKQ